MEIVFLIIILLVTPMLLISTLLFCLIVEFLGLISWVLWSIGESIWMTGNLIRICLFLRSTCSNRVHSGFGPNCTGIRKDRGSDHGVAHGYSVCAKAVRIRLHMLKENGRTLKTNVLHRIYLVMGAALLHDVKDKKCRKYRPIGTSEDYFDTLLTQFMSGVYCGDDMMKIISNISYSQEHELKKNSGTRKNFREENLCSWIRIHRFTNSTFIRTEILCCWY